MFATKLTGSRKVIAVVLAVIALLPSAGCGYCLFNIGCGPGLCCDGYVCRECLLAAREVQVEAEVQAAESENDCPWNKFADFLANLLPPQQ